MAVQTRKISVDPDTPGYGTLMNLASEALSPVYVTDLKPIDVSYIKDSAIRAVVVLAASCEWNVLHRPGRQVTLISRSGFKQSIPTNTSVKYGVFLNRLGAINTHSFTHLPTAELIDKLLNQYKLDASHARAFRLLVPSVSTKPQPDEDTDDEQFTEQGDTPEDEAEGHDEEDDMHPEIPDSEVAPYSERVEPTLSTAAKGLQYVSQIMETVIRQLVPDGEDQITYRCLVCGLEFPTKRGVGGHYGGHVTRGEAEAKPEARDNAVKVTPTPTNQIGHNHPASAGPDPDNCAACSIGDQPGEYEAVIESVLAVPWPEVVAMRIEQGHIESDELTRLRRIVDRIAELVGREHIEQLQERCQELTIERDAAVTRAERLASDLRTLRELIGGLSSE